MLLLEYEGPRVLVVTTTRKRNGGEHDVGNVHDHHRHRTMMG
jgi:hypothetical protein